MSRSTDPAQGPEHNSIGTMETAFYITGGTLPPDARSYLERAADSELFQALRDGEFCYVLTSRQMGKSSLMVRTAARLRREGVTTVALDLTAVGQNLSAEQWYDGLLHLLSRGLGLEDELEEYWLGKERFGPIQRWMQALREVALEKVPGQIVLFIDEIDAVRSLPFSADEFFSAIRECYNRRSEIPEYRRLTFCLLGVATPGDLIRDTRNTPFNIGHRIELTDFTEEEAAPLAAGLGVQAFRRSDEEDDPIKSEVERPEPLSPETNHLNARTPERLLSRILYWTSGHPYLTQRLCQAVGRDPRFQGSGAVDSLCERLFFSPGSRDVDDNLQFVRERLLRSGEELVDLLKLYERVLSGRRVENHETNPLVTVLKLSGVVRVISTCDTGGAGRLVIRNRLYERAFDRRWIAAHMPGAEVRRQRAAYRLGLVRATAAASVVVGLAGALAWTSFRSAAREKRLASDRQVALAGAGDLLYASQMNLAHLSHEDQYVRAWRLLELHRPMPGAPDRRDFVWRFLWRMCRSQDRHTLPQRVGEVSSVAYSRDGKVLAAAGADGNVQLWDSTGMIPLETVRAHPGASVVTFSPDGKLLATLGRSDGALKLWDLTSRPVRLARQFPAYHRQWARILFTPDGTTMISGMDDNTIRLWDMGSGDRSRSRAIPVFSAGPMALSGDGRTLAVCSGGKEASRITFWNIAGRQVKLLPISLPPEGLVQSMAFSPDGRRLVTGAGAPVLWDVVTGRRLREYAVHTGVILGTEFSPDGTVIASCGSDGTIRLWNPESGRLLAALHGHTSRITSIAYSPGGDTLASASDDGTARLWDTDIKRLRKAARERNGYEILSAGIEGVRGVTFSPDGRLIAEARSRTIRFWSPATKTQVGRPLVEESGPRPGQVLLPRGLAFSADGKRLASGSTDGTVRLWDVPDCKEISPPLIGHQFGVSHVGFAAHGILVSGNGGAAGGVPASIRLWNLASHKGLGKLTGDPMTPLGSLAISPDGTTVATGSPDQKIVLWDVAGRQRVATLEGTANAASLAFSPDNKLIAAGQRDGVVFLWDRASGRLLRRLDGHAGPVLALAFSPDSKTLASGGMDGTIRLWNPAVSQEEATLTGHQNWIFSLAFSPDGNLLISGSPDGTVRLWRAAPFTETDAPSALRAPSAAANHSGR